MPKVSARVVLNRSRVNTMRLGVADGLFHIAETMLMLTRPPSDVSTETPAATIEEVGKRKFYPLSENGGAIVYVDGKKVAGMGLDGRQPKKPRAARLLPFGMTAIVGWGFPARFNELGTVNQPARPFFTPVVYGVLPEAAPTVRASVRRFLNRLGA